MATQEVEAMDNPEERPAISTQNRHQNSCRKSPRQLICLWIAYMGSTGMQTLMPMNSYVHTYCTELVKLNRFFETADAAVVLILIDDQLCKMLCDSWPDTDNEPVKERSSVDDIRQGHDVLVRLAQLPDHKALDEASQTAVVKLFSSLQSAHNALATISGHIVTFGSMLPPEQFDFIMKLSIRPLIQLKIPARLCSPADLKFEKETLTPEELWEERKINLVLPRPFHP